MHFAYSGIFGFLVLVADVYAIVSVVGSASTTGKKVAWIILILLLPILGWLVWLIAGPRSLR